MPEKRKQAGQRQTKKRIPRFKSLEEEAAFWDTHSPLDYEDEVEEVDIKVAQPLGHVLTIRLDAKTIGRLGAIGRRKGLGASTLARMWLLERLEQEERDAGRSKTRRPKSA